VAGNTGFACNNDIPANGGTPGNTRLGRDQCIVSNFDIVGDMDLIVGFNAVADEGDA